MTEMPYLCWAFLYTSTGVNSYYLFMIKLHNSKNFTVNVQQRMRKEGTFDAPTIRISVTPFLIPYKKRGNHLK
ncbi:hypothetical protein CN643_17960 [Parageobacillus yumthangensis]|nr:hypothetical protein CN643_17960 [Parageobacillus yumthangensis]